MIAFWAAGAGLAIVALLLLLRPAGRKAGPSHRDANVSVYRDQLRELEADLAAGKLAQADYERSRAELEARLLEDAGAPDAGEAPRRGQRTLLGLAAGIPIVALGIYLAVGSPAAIVAPQQQHDVGAMVARLEAHLKANPDDGQGWALLGRTYAALERFQESVDAYSRAALRSPKDAQLLADYADALAMARGQTLEGEPEKLIARALEADPKNMKALALAGTLEFNRKRFTAAADYWRRMLPQVEPGSEDARIIQGNIGEALALANARPLTGTVQLSSKLKDKVAPDDTVFVYARAAEGPQMPLAILRLKARELPAKFSLNDAMAMAPGMNLSAHPRVVITARVSKSGQATPQPGDLQGASKPVANDASGVAVVIDSQVR
jgi:cytochrome c-type biogenesis protein CcmH